MIVDFQCKNTRKKLWKKCVAQGGEGAGLVEVGVDAVEHRLNVMREGGSDGLRRQCDFEGANVAPVSARHLGSGRGEVSELNQLVAARMSEAKAKPLGAFRCEDEDVGGADAIERGDADFVEVGP